MADATPELMVTERIICTFQRAGQLYTQGANIVISEPRNPCRFLVRLPFPGKVDLAPSFRHPVAPTHAGHSRHWTSADRREAEVDDFPENNDTSAGDPTPLRPRNRRQMRWGVWPRHPPSHVQRDEARGVATSPEQCASPPRDSTTGPPRLLPSGNLLGWSRPSNHREKGRAAKR